MKTITKASLGALLIWGSLSGCAPEEELSVYPCGSSCVKQPEASADDDGQLWGLFKGVYVDGDRTAALKVHISADFAQEGSSAQVRYGADTLDADVASWDQEMRSFSFATEQDPGCVEPTCYSVRFTLNINETSYPTGSELFMKESSSALVKVYEGSYSGDREGRCGFLVEGMAVLLGRCDANMNQGDAPRIGGFIFDNGFFFESEPDEDVTPTTFHGFISSDEATIQGLWSNSLGSGEWVVERTL